MLSVCPAVRRVFETKRKAHYNEFEAMKLARSLMTASEDEEDEDDNTQEKADSEPSEKSPKPPSTDRDNDQPSSSK